MIKPILHTEQLSIGYREKKSVVAIANHISISLLPGKLVALVGANGVGKSTLLRTLTGIQPSLEGHVLLNGNTIDSYSATQLARQLSVVLTEKLPPSNLTVFEIVALGRQPYTNWVGTLSAEDREKINAAIDHTQIREFLHKKHFEISDGQLQKVLIARALAQDTPLIILDEPTTHLDLGNKVSLLKLLKQLTQETSKCILFSTHDLDLAIQLSDEMIVMSNEITVQKTPEALISSGIFNRLFGDQNVYFDDEKGKFVLRTL